MTSTSTERQRCCQNLAPVLVIISGNSLVFSKKIITSTGFYRCCAPGASAPVVVKHQSPTISVFGARFNSLRVMQSSEPLPYDHWLNYSQFRWVHLSLSQEALKSEGGDLKGVRASDNGVCPVNFHSIIQFSVLLPWQLRRESAVWTLSRRTGVH